MLISQCSRSSFSRRDSRAASLRRRDGYVLVAVLVMIVVLTLLAYRFTDAMTSEYRGASRTADMTKLRAAAISGIHFAAASLGDPVTFTLMGGNSPMITPSIFNNQTYFGDVTVTLDENNDPNKTIMFSIVSVVPVPGMATSQQSAGVYQQQYGVIDEGGKLNINAWAAIDPTGNALYQALLLLPYMEDNEQTAANIVAYVLPMPTTTTGGTSGGSTGGSTSSMPSSTSAASGGSSTTTYANSGLIGAQTSTYESLPNPYQAKNGPLNSLDELLLVEGVTPGLLFGNDQNLSGIATPASQGLVDRGWQDYLTVNGRELNVNMNGQLRIYLGGSSLSGIQTALQSSTVDPTLQTYIIGALLYGTTPVPSTTKSQTGRLSDTNGVPNRLPTYEVASLPPYQRMFQRIGPPTLDHLSFLAKNPTSFMPAGGAQGGRTQGGGTQGGGTQGGGTQGGGTQGGRTQGGGTQGGGTQGGGTQGGGTQGGRTPSGGGGGAPKVRQGATSDLATAITTSLQQNPSSKPKPLASIASLANSQVSFPDPTTKGGTVVVASPLTTATMTQYLPNLLDQVTLLGQGGSVQVELTPRINVSTASAQVLSMLPILTPTDVSSLISAQTSLMVGDPANTSGAWMVTTGGLSLSKYQAISQYVTGTSMLYRVQAIGYYSGTEANASNGMNAANWPMARVEALIDTNLGFPRIVYIRDLTSLDNPRAFNLPLQQAQP